MIKDKSILFKKQNIYGEVNKDITIKSVHPYHSKNSSCMHLGRKHREHEDRD